MSNGLIEKLRSSAKGFATDIFECEEHSVICTPLFFPNGDAVTLYVQHSDRVSPPKPDDQLQISDLGTTSDFLLTRKVMLDEVNKETIHSILSLHECRWHQRELQRCVDSPRLLEGIIRVAQAAVQLSTLAYGLDRSPKSDYAEEVARTIHNIIEPKRQVTRNWHEPRQDPHGAFTVDFHVNGAGAPRNIFVVSSIGKIMRMAASTYFLRANGINHPTMAVIAPDVQLGDKQLERIQLSSDKMIFGIESKVGELEEFALAET